MRKTAEIERKREKIGRMAESPIRMIIHTVSGEFIDGGPYEPAPPVDPAYSVVTIPGDLVPNPKLKRYDANGATKLRDATPQEQATWETNRKDRQADRLMADPVFLALVQVDWEERSKLVPVLGQTLLTLAQAKVRARTIYRELLNG